MSGTAKPKVVSAAEWQQARDELLKAEKEATRTLDAIAAKRRRLPMVKFDDYTFATPDGSTTLRDLFGDRVQLAVYQFMDNGPDEFCPGCTWFTKNVVNLDGLAENGVAWATVSNMPIAQIEAYKAKMGWTMPFVSSRGTSFADDCGTVRLRAQHVPAGRQDVYQTYFTKPAASTGCCSSTTCLTSPRTAGRRIGRTRRPAGRSTPPTGRARRRRPLPAGETTGRNVMSCICVQAEREEHWFSLVRALVGRAGFAGAVGVRLAAAVDRAGGRRRGAGR